MAIDYELLRGYARDQERRGLLPSSVDKGRSHVRIFMMYTDVLVATTEDVERFLDARKIGPKTRYGWLTQLHGFYRWMNQKGYRDDDPTERIIRPKLRRMLPRPASTEDLLLALSSALPLMRCWILLACFQGFRCKEIAGLQAEDVLVTQRLIRVSHAKGNHDRILPLHEDVLLALNALPMPRYGPVFPDVNPQQVSSRLNEFFDDLGIACTAHQLRHWFGTELYRSTKDLRLVQEMLGHQSPTSTAIYTAFDRSYADEGIRSLKLGDAS